MTLVQKQFKTITVGLNGKKEANLSMPNMRLKHIYQNSLRDQYWININMIASTETSVFKKQQKPNVLFTKRLATFKEGVSFIWKRSVIELRIALSFPWLSFLVTVSHLVRAEPLKTTDQICGENYNA